MWLYGGTVTRRWRILLFGAAGAAVLAGGACAALVGGIVGEVLTIVLLAGGLAGGLLLVFLEIGLDEERELAREEELRRRRAGARRDLRTARWPRGLQRRPRRPG